MLSSGGQSRASNTVTSNSPHASLYLETTERRGQGGQKQTHNEKAFLFISTAFLLSSCAAVKSPVTGYVYQETQSPVSVTSNPLGSKKGEATATSVLGWFAFGDASVQKAAKDGGITKISHIDQKSTSVLGLFAKYTITVYGD